MKLDNNYILLQNDVQPTRKTKLNKVKNNFPSPLYLMHQNGQK